MIGRGRRASLGSGADPPPASKPGQAETAASLAEQLAHVRALYDGSAAITGCASGSSTRASISAGPWRSRPSAARAAETLKGWRQKILASEDLHRVHLSLQDAYDDFAWSAAA